ncbi:hypothetical protein P8Q88_09050 [Qipengyuania sp. XHP0207]|uniref:hypothetical protein n=1 Tax=Qipengyuania sp. XHP0207 TaxID=3038078 RepID=UPI00241E318F|nr:hypothetical protein [Qipengyuania sp. XHP0207]MDG5748329.1 hypothetical protein [Qipengyuania sp. XHP0207]
MSFLISLGTVLLAQQAIAIDQVGSGTNDAAAPEAMEQLSSRDDARVTEPIGTPEAARNEDLEQLTRPDTTVEFARVEGMDRCSAELLSAKDADYCARRLETRSSEFATRSEVPLTAEQVLVGEKFASMAGEGVADASRTAGRRETSPEDRDLQALASIALVPAPNTPATPAEEEDSKLPAETEALIEAIVNQLSQQGGG